MEQQVPEEGRITEGNTLKDRVLKGLLEKNQFTKDRIMGGRIMVS